jgi:hypothetical protein
LLFELFGSIIGTNNAGQCHQFPSSPLEDGFFSLLMAALRKEMLTFAVAIDGQ